MSNNKYRDWSMEIERRTPPSGGSGVTKSSVFSDEQEQIENLREWISELEEEIRLLKLNKVDKYNRETILC